jgi:hypothetical protein
MLIIQNQKICFGLLFTVLVLSIGMSYGQTVWKPVSPLPQGNNLNSVTYGDSQFVAVGAAGIILTSSGDTAWAIKNSGTSNDLNSVAFGNGRFVAVGGKGAIVSSPDGTVWTIRNSGLSTSINSVTFGSDLFIAVGDSGKIVSSPDGVRWTIKHSGAISDLFPMTFGNGRFIIVTDSIVTSFDGTAWTTINPGLSPNSYITALAYGNGQFLAVKSQANYKPYLQCSIRYYTFTIFNIRRLIRLFAGLIGNDEILC